jgi:hypothetical protein
MCFLVNNVVVKGIITIPLLNIIFHSHSFSFFSSLNSSFINEHSLSFLNSINVQQCSFYLNQLPKTLLNRDIAMQWHLFYVTMHFDFQHGPCYLEMHSFFTIGIYIKVILHVEVCKSLKKHGGSTQS